MHDITLIHLETDIEFNNNVMPVKLPPRNPTSYDDSEATMINWEKPNVGH